MKKNGDGEALVLAYAGCTTCKNALKWLAAQKIPHRVRPIVDEPPTAKELAAWIPASGLSVRKWLNTSGQSYRAIGKESIDAASDADLAKRLVSDGKLVKRPVLVRGGTVLVGFKPEAWGAALLD
jgi:arsenate reductase